MCACHVNNDYLLTYLLTYLHTYLLSHSFSGHMLAALGQQLSFLHFSVLGNLITIIILLRQSNAASHSEQVIICALTALRLSYNFRPQAQLLHGVLVSGVEKPMVFLKLEICFFCFCFVFLWFLWFLVF